MAANAANGGKIVRFGSNVMTVIIWQDGPQLTTCWHHTACVTIPACLDAAEAGASGRLQVGAADLQAALEGFTPAAYWGVGKLSGADTAAKVMLLTLPWAAPHHRMAHRSAVYNWGPTDIDAYTLPVAIRVG